MPTGYSWSSKLGRWVKKTTENGFDYENTNLESGAFIISFFRWYPDLLLDMIESDNADFKLELPERLAIRSCARYSEFYETGPRGIGKTYCLVLARMLDGVLFPNEIMRYCGPSYKQVAELAAVAFHQIEKNYPALAAMYRIKSETKDTFSINTEYGSEFCIQAIQGGNCSSLTAEEIGQETNPKFEFADFESKTLPTCRIPRRVNKGLDRVHINFKKQYITNASRRQNRAYYKYRANAFKRMSQNAIRRAQGLSTAFACDYSWEMSIISNIRDIEYIEDLKSKLTVEDWLRQMAARYTGTAENPIVRDETLAKAKVLTAMEDSHCGDEEAIYIVAHDVSYEDGTRNAKCADVVWKLTKYTDKANATIRRGKYRKQAVYVDSYAPPKTDVLQAQKLKDLWFRYCMDGAQPTYLVVDAQAYGKSVIEELMSPTNDGLPTLCCYDHIKYQELEQKDALPIIYPLKAGVRGTLDPDNDIIRYAQIEFEQGNVEILISDVLEGIEQYKRRHNIKDDTADSRIILPYQKTLEMCEQIQNLKIVPSGSGISEKRISTSIQRDIWSACKYGLWFASILEKVNLSEKRKTSDWQREIEKYKGSANAYATAIAATNARSKILSLWKGKR